VSLFRARVREEPPDDRRVGHPARRGTVKDLAADDEGMPALSALSWFA